MNTIKVKDFLKHIEEFEAAATIIPGMLIEMTSAEKVQAHSSGGQNIAPIMFAVEDDLQGNGIDDSYTSGNKAQCWIPQRGDIVYAIVADGQDIDKGDLLESNGDGYLTEHAADVAEGGSSAEAVADTTIYTQQIVGMAMENVDTNSSSAEESSDSTLGYARRVKVMVV